MELSKHFHDSKSCSFDRDLRVHVLENVEGGIDALLHRESQWMSMLGTHEPMDLNSSCNELGRIHCKLFSKTN